MDLLLAAITTDGPNKIALFRWRVFEPSLVLNAVAASRTCYVRLRAARQFSSNFSRCLVAFRLGRTGNNPPPLLYPHMLVWDEEAHRYYWAFCEPLIGPLPSLR